MTVDDAACEYWEQMLRMIVLLPGSTYTYLVGIIVFTELGLVLMSRISRSSLDIIDCTVLCFRMCALVLALPAFQAGILSTWQKCGLQACLFTLWLVVLF